MQASIVRDGRRGQRPVLRDEAGDPMVGADGQPVPLKNEKLRYDLFPKGGQAGDGAQGQDPFLGARIRVKDAVNAREMAVSDLAVVLDDDGNKLVEQQGLPAEAKTWRKQLNAVNDLLSDWYEVGVEYRASNADTPGSTSAKASGDEPDEA